MPPRSDCCVGVRGENGARGSRPVTLLLSLKIRRVGWDTTSAMVAGFRY
ncbi:hypothetical protein J2X01_001751 [Arthrobacter ginsengisoli]|uniref:Uncharacterized protein n=1 Tax=Arthrobacter ginsengisoli TaxID=1356565 RepID=A0ABU1UB84_9MICC|nr:hypothetical protein [Arthrobacter ginsengisoli]